MRNVMPSWGPTVSSWARTQIRAGIVLLLLLVGVSRVAFAQARPEIDIRVAPTAYPPVVAVRGVLTEQPFDELLRSGFPARLHVRAELWTIGRWFDDVLARAEWDIVVRFDAIDRTYDVARFVAGRLTSLGSDLDELERWLRGEASPAVRGKRNPGTALTRGVRSLASRLLGGEVRRLEAKSPAVTY